MSKKLGGTELKRLNRGWRRGTSQRLAVVLDDVQNPFNVGAIVRTAAALGVDHLWVAGHATAPTHPKVDKTALGSARLVPWSAAADGFAAVEAARAEGYLVVALELTDDARPVFALDLAGDVCVVAGHEDRGVAAATLAAADAVAYVPQLGRVASLNVATATAIALYESRRQHLSRG